MVFRNHLKAGFVFVLGYDLDSSVRKCKKNNYTNSKEKIREREEETLKKLWRKNIHWDEKRSIRSVSCCPSYRQSYTLTTVPTWLLLLSLNADCLGLLSKFSRSARSLSRSIRFIMYTWFGVSLIKRSRISCIYGQRCIGGFGPFGADT